MQNFQPIKLFLYKIYLGCNMIENKELYGYIVNSIEIMNKSIVANEQNTVKLFSYVYNHQNNLYSNINKLNKKYEAIDVNFQNIVNRYNINVWKNINETNDKVEKLEKKINSLENQIKEQSNNIITAPIIIEETHKSKNIFLEFIKSIYNRCYNFIFRKRIMKKHEVEKKLQEEFTKKEEEIKNKQYKQRIQDILNTCHT